MVVQTDTVAPGRTPEQVEARAAGDRFVVTLRGAWVTERLADLAAALRGLRPDRPAVRVDLQAVEALDTNGALLIRDTVRDLERGGATVELAGLSPRRQALLEAVAGAVSAPAERRREPHPMLATLERIGRHTIGSGIAARDLLNFLGAVTIVLVGSLARPWRLRGPALVAQMEHTGLDALPIVGLLSFLIGVVLAYQGADQLARFGAEIFTVNLVGIGVLREMGVLLTAIIVAGRSGSAFAAQIGTMKVNQEIDALRTIGLDPLEVLVVPRVLGLMLVMPLLTFYADMLGLFGGAVMATLALDISFGQFAIQLHGAVDAGTFWVGMVKAPLFAFIIAVVGCFEGLQVSQSAESVGFRTTKAVVVGIFLIILLDALLSVFFSLIGV